MMRGSSSPSSRVEAPGLPAMLRRFWPLVWKERLVLSGSLVALFAEIGLRLLEPWPLKLVFDHVIAISPGGGADLPLVGSLGPMTLLTLAALSVVVIMGLRSVAVYFNTVGLTLAGNRILTQIRGDVYRHLQSLSLSFHHRQRQGDLTLRLISDVGVLKDVILTAFFPLLANVLILVGMLGTMFLIDPRLALIAAAILPCFWLVSARFGRRIRAASRIQRKREGTLASTAAESVAAIKVVQALSLESAFEESFTTVNRGSLGDSEKVSRLSAGLARTVDLFVAAATALVLWFGTSLVLARELTPGDLLVFLTYLKNAFRPVQDFAKYSARLAKGSAAAERVLDLMGRTAEVRDLPGAVTAPAFRGAVRFEDVSFGYEPNNLALQRIRLAVEPGQRVALTGPSGGGKSTLLSLLLRLYDPTEGGVLIDGRDIREFTIASLRRQITIVLQDTVLFAASASDNIAYGSPNATRAEIETAARLANAHDFIQKLPEGYDTVLGERGVTVSTGQRQRIAIARAAIRHSPILILDEPTTALDESNARAVIEALERVTRGSTTFLVTHDPRLATTADLVVYMEAGQVVEQGPPAALLRAGGPYARLHELHMTGRPITGDAIAVVG
jgi:ATP-binding cassette, subfamily B, bacterial